jgi:hypothetical protein
MAQVPNCGAYLANSEEWMFAEDWHRFGCDRIGFAT